MSASPDVTRFPRGFVLADRPVAVPDTFEESPFLPYLYVHPWLQVEAEAGDGSFVVVLGLCQSVESGAAVRPAPALHAALLEGDRAFFSVLARRVGRFVVIYGDAEATRVVTDATSMRSVFYADGAPLIASHAVLIERALGGEVVRNELPHQYGFPGNHTPYARTKVLTPNLTLDIGSGAVQRFWPERAIQPRSVDDAAHSVLGASVRGLQNASMGREVRVGLSGGLSSRTVLALAMAAGVEFSTYTFGTDKKSVRDRSIAEAVASKASVRHERAGKPDWTDELRKRVSEVNSPLVHGRLVQGLSELFGHHRALSVTGNLMEFSRPAFARLRESGFPPPVTAESMVALHRASMNGRTQRRIERFGEDEWTAHATRAFHDFIETSAFTSVTDLVDPYKLFRWEHRSAMWFGTSLVERDFYADTFSPINARAILEDLLSVNDLHDGTEDLLAYIIAMVEPRLLKVAVEP